MIKRELADSYFALVRRHPLKTIRNDAELASAQVMIDGLLTESLDGGATDYLDALSDLVLLYERDVHPIPSVPPHRRLAHLLDANGMTQAELSRRTGLSKATVSDLVTGKRPFTVAQMDRIGSEFALPASAFLPGRR